MFDSYNRRINYLRISVTDLCNYRCEYCMPPEGVPLRRHDDILSFEEITAFTRKAAEMGIDKVRLTGGEPLVRRGIVSLVKMLSEIDGIKDFSMTTNGALLNEYAGKLKEAGLHRLNISLDTLCPDKFAEITRGGNLDDVFRGIEAARSAHFRKIKLNCVIENNPDEPDARSVKKYGDANGLEVRFIHRMDISKGIFHPVIGGDGGDCKTCNRLRLSSDGRIFPCLISDLSFSIKELGADVAIKETVKNKPLKGSMSKRKFYMIGG